MSALRSEPVIHLPGRAATPVQSVARRLAFGLALVAFVAAIVYLGRHGYADDTGGTIGVLDAVYYASVSITTTGYGDITPVSPGARLATTLLVTPARVVFLILLVGTTIEVLTERSRQAWRVQRWRRRLRSHIVICGFGTTGSSAARALLAQGVPRRSMVVVDVKTDALEAASSAGITAVRGDASLTQVLESAGIAEAEKVVVTPNRDDTAVLITLTARELNPLAHIVTAVRESENRHLVEQSGANVVIMSSESVGRLLGVATHLPNVAAIIDDLLEAGTGLDLVELEPEMQADGTLWVPAGVMVVSVLRAGRQFRFDDPAVRQLLPGDRLVALCDNAPPG